MNNLKLRFYCKEHGFVESGFDAPITAVYFNQHDVLGLACPLCFKSRPMELLLYTPFLDKNGVRICQGDIVQYQDVARLFPGENAPRPVFGVNWTAEVKYDNGAFHFGDVLTTFWNEIRNPADIEGWDFPSLLEVIGNVKENPELLS